MTAPSCVCGRAVRTASSWRHEWRQVGTGAQLGIEAFPIGPEIVVLRLLPRFDVAREAGDDDLALANHRPSWSEVVAQDALCRWDVWPYVAFRERAAPPRASQGSTAL
jgi:hypothetical protein